MSTRLTTNPGVSWQRIGFLPRRSPTANAASTASSDDSSARTISTSGMSGRGIEEVHPDDPLGRRDTGCDLGHRQRGRVGREDRVRADDALERAEELELGVELLDDRLDHEVARGEVGEVGRQRERRERRLALVGAHPLLVDLALQEVRDPVARLRAELVATLHGRPSRSRPRWPAARSRRPWRRDPRRRLDGSRERSRPRDPTRAPTAETADDLSRGSGGGERRRRCANPRRETYASGTSATMSAMRMYPNMTSWCTPTSISTSLVVQQIDQWS